MDVLVTRPEPGAGETAAAVAALGWTPVLAPALRLVGLPFTPPRDVQAILFASRAAARSTEPVARPVFAVGEATADEARARGFTDVVAAAGDAAALAALVGRQCDPTQGPVLLAVGEGYGRELAAMLEDRGFTVRRCIAYRAEPEPRLPDAARAALAAGQVHAALFHSPRSAAATVAQLRAAGLEGACARVTALALSPRIAEALRPLPWRHIHASTVPSGDALLALLGRAPNTTRLGEPDV